MPPRKPLTVSQKWTVGELADEPAITVSRAEWEKIMERIKTCVDHHIDFGAVMWGCLGIAASALLSAVAFPFGAEFIKALPDGEKINRAAVVIECGMVILAVAGIGVSIVAFVFSRRTRAVGSILSSWILDDMKRHKARHHAPASPEPSPSPEPAAPVVASDN
jgi:hypothetical protein